MEVINCELNEFLNMSVCASIFIIMFYLCSCPCLCSQMSCLGNKVITTVVVRPLDDRTIVFVLRSLIWGFGESRTIVQGINSEPEKIYKCPIKRAVLTFSSISNRLAVI